MNDRTLLVVPVQGGRATALVVVPTQGRRATVDSDVSTGKKKLSKNHTTRRIIYMLFARITKTDTHDREFVALLMGQIFLLLTLMLPMTDVHIAPMLPRRNRPLLSSHSYLLDRHTSEQPHINERRHSRITLRGSQKTPQTLRRRAIQRKEIRTQCCPAKHNETLYI